MSKFCPFCDDVKDSNLDSPKALKEHLNEEHKNEVAEAGKPEKLEDQNKHGGDEIDEAVQAKFREIKESP